MTIAFNADEVFEMAEQIERNGGKFYRKAAEKNNDASARALLSEIADQEDEHLAAFKEMRKELGRRENEPTTFDPYGEAALYLKAMADGRVFDLKEDPAAKLKGDESLAAIIQTAIGLEKDSIIFYLGLKETMPQKLGADRITAIINEEMKHIRWLSDKLGDNA